MTQKLLLADDSVTIQRVIELTFADEDISVAAVSDGRQAIERIVSDRPDIVLADVGMPEQDGYQVASFIKSNPELAHIPVLLLTGAFEPVDQARAESAGCDGVLAKPFEPQLLIARVKELLAAAGAPARPVPAASPARPSIELPGELRPAARELELPRASWTPPADRARPLAEPPMHLTPEPGPAAPEMSLDEYFDHLDQAFASLSSSMPERAVSQAIKPPEALEPDVAATFTPDWRPNRLIAPDPRRPDRAMPAMPAEPEPVGAAAAAPAVPAQIPLTRPVLPSVADVFDAFLAAEEGAPLPSWASAPGVPAATVSTEALVEQVTRRVLEHLTDRVVRETVAEIVSATAERLVRQEIERIKADVR